MGYFACVIYILVLIIFPEQFSLINLFPLTKIRSLSYTLILFIYKRVNVSRDKCFNCLLVDFIIFNQPQIFIKMCRVINENY